MKFENLTDLLLIKLQALYDIETEIIKSLPKLEKCASHRELKAAYRHHLQETKKQKERLEKVFSLLDIEPRKLKLAGIRGLITDAEALMNARMRPKVMDASLVAASQHIELYEVAGYREAEHWAEAVDRSDVATLLSMNLDEEIRASQKLDSLAFTVIRSEWGIAR